MLKPENADANTHVILGIDPGYDRCGFAVISHVRGDREVLLYSDCFVTDRTRSFEQRLVAVGTECARIIQSYTPAQCALEKVYFTSNQKTAMRVAEVRGVLLYLACTHGLSIVEYSPNEIKVAIAGDGRADKKQVTSMVPRLVRVEKTIQYDDEYDAIAVALTASASTTLRP